jgi:D-3-phosphoglycerate dehydrogenase
LRQNSSKTVELVAQRIDTRKKTTRNETGGKDQMARVLVTEKIAEAGLDSLRQAGHEVDVELGLDPDGLLLKIPGYQALIIRSATKVTREVLTAGSDLQVVGRAGIGVDNIDLDAATERGVLVVNAPESNIISAAEHTMALLLAQARNVPQSNAAVLAGKWERSKWEGVELYGKTLGIIGLGRIGTLVAQRAKAFGMHLVAYDPYISPERAEQLGITLLGLEALMSQSDFVTIHLPKSPETMGLVSKELLAHAKEGLRIVNAARGGIIDEEALAEALKSGRLGGAALDVFKTEPPEGSPLLSIPSVVITPHLGASTREAQDKAGTQIAEQVEIALAGGLPQFSVNLTAGSVSAGVAPFVRLSEQLGRFFASFHGGLPKHFEVAYEGAIAEEDTSLLTLSVLKGVFSVATDDPVSYVNAGRIAKERGLVVREVRVTNASGDYANLVRLTSETHEVAGTRAGTKGEGRIVIVDGHAVEVPPAAHMVVVENDDHPGMIGIVGTVLGKHGISITDMAVSPAPQGGPALMLLATDQEVPIGVLEELAKSTGILSVHDASCM